VTIRVGDDAAERHAFARARKIIKSDGTMYAHDAGRPGMRKRCPGAGRTKEEAKAEREAANSEGRRPTVLSGQPERVDAPKEVRPEDIF